YSNAAAVTDPTQNTFRDIDLDFSKVTQYATSGVSNLTAVKGGLDGKGAGKQFGNMNGVSVDTSGKIYGKYDNGDRILLGQIAVASFSNPAGLEAVGDNMFAATQNSGDFDGIGQDPTQGGEGLLTGVLEMSNVDLSEQFTEMITTQRGFQANSRIITTSDTLLEELINLKR
ncbi:MAG TPA: flagellar hook protein, partial [Lachnospiraceae bacterium]|nr:flagellar hook protein [Lachnospiraceae bacterium]HCR40795.1 flagellar hook protein [Lachnospiraceae bacterium]